MAIAYFIEAQWMPMTTEDARADLERAIRASGSDLAAASKALNRNHAYLQQFVRTGKPRYLNEQDRTLLASLYGIDPDPLKPPPKKLPADNRDNAGGSTGSVPRVGDPIQDAIEATIIGAWRKMTKQDQDWVISVINGALRNRGLPPIAA